MIETWNESGVPLEAVLRGIDAAFEKWRSRKVTQNGQLACLLLHKPCSPKPSRCNPSAKPRRPFPLEDVRAYLESNTAAIADSLRRMAADIEVH